jgi:hypothetical protein
MYVCIYVCTPVCMYVCNYVCMWVGMRTCVYRLKLCLDVTSVCCSVECLLCIAQVMCNSEVKIVSNPVQASAATIRR